MGWELKEGGLSIRANGHMSKNSGNGGEIGRDKKNYLIISLEGPMLGKCYFEPSHVNLSTLLLIRILMRERLELEREREREIEREMDK